MIQVDQQYFAIVKTDSFTAVLNVKTVSFTAVLNALRQLSTTTSILSDPSRMPEHATEAVLKTDKSGS